MAKIRQIAQLGAPILRQKARPVDYADPATLEIIADMQATLTDTSGVGLAAPQINESVQILIISSKPSPRYPHAPLMQPVVMLNPSFTAVAREKEKDWEGCLSIPGIRAQVPRYKKISINFTSIDGIQQTIVYQDFVARVFQHEYDHLQGKVYLDQVEDTLDIISEFEFQKLIAA